MKLFYLIPIIIFAIVFLIIAAKRYQTDKLTADKLEYLRYKYIIKHKDQFAKKVIQKAQQGIDTYLSKKTDTKSIG